MDRKAVMYHPEYVFFLRIPLDEESEHPISFKNVKPYRKAIVTFEDVYFKTEGIQAINADLIDVVTDPKEIKYPVYVKSTMIDNGTLISPRKDNKGFTCGCVIGQIYEPNMRDVVDRVMVDKGDILEINHYITLMDDDKREVKVGVLYLTIKIQPMS